MNRPNGIMTAAMLLAMLVLTTIVASTTQGPTPVSGPDASMELDAGNLRCSIDARSGDAVRLTSRVGRASHQWMKGPIHLEVRNEVSGTRSAPSLVSSRAAPDKVSVERRLPALSLSVAEQWTRTAGGIAWDLEFKGEQPRAGHAVIIDLPILSPSSQIFTPSEHGVTSVETFPSLKLAPYANNVWKSGRFQFHVLPLVSVFDKHTDNALTLALPADRNIPHLQVEWIDARVLRLHLGHRGMGGGQPSPLRLLFYAHPADYRAALKAYSDAFPAYFKPGLPRGPYEGTFWYHHIQDHPDFEEMARQNVRYIWTSFWFSHLGEYLPDEAEWYPYTYAKKWKLGQKMNDAMIRQFAKEMHAHQIGTYAYFNVTEYGGAGGEAGDTEVANRLLREQFANALIKNEKGEAIPTWEGAMAMNPGRAYSLFPLLVEQVRRHLTRLPELDGFIIDRLDWASLYDYGHDDGLSMVGDRTVENLAVPVADAVQEVCRLAHAAGKRVYVNMFYRVEVLRDADGYCHEHDYVRGLGYVSPFRPASAWHLIEEYEGDLLPFEAQLKERLQFAVFPHMIAHEFPISQQKPDPRAADFLEIYEPLFSMLRGKEAVLMPHCIGVTGANDVNLFTNDSGHYVVPVTSRVQFLSRLHSTGEKVSVSLRVPDAGDLTWAHVYSADGPPYRAALARQADITQVTATKHLTSSVIVVGKGTEPALEARQDLRINQIREKLFPAPQAVPAAPVRPPSLSDMVAANLVVTGAHVGASSGPISVIVSGLKLGELLNGENRFDLPPALREKLSEPLEIRFVTGDEGTWFVVEQVQLKVELADKKSHCVAKWTPQINPAAESTASNLRVVLR